MGSTYGLGSVTQRKDGRWTWRSPPRQDGKRKVIYEKSERAARTAGRRWLLSDEGNAWMGARPDARPATDITLAEAVTEYLDAAKDRVRTATHNQYRSLLGSHVLPNRGHIPLNRLTADHVRTLFEDLRGRDVTLSTVQATYLVLRQVMKHAIERGWLAESANPMAQVRRPGGSKRARVKAQDAIRYWTQDELRRVLDAADAVLPTQGALLFHLLAGTGCRISEALGLRFRDLRANKLSFSRTWSKARQVEDMKSTASRRTIPVSAKLVERIEAEQERRGAGLDAFVFDAGSGKPHGQDNIRSRWLPKVIEAAGVPPRTLHEIRHSSVVLLMEAGASMKAISLRLGHQDVATTLGVYAHISPQLEDQLVTALDKALG